MMIQKDLFCFDVISYVAVWIHSSSLVSCTYKIQQNVNLQILRLVFYCFIRFFTRSISTSPRDKNNGVKVWQLGVELASCFHTIKDRIRKIERALFDLHIALKKERKAKSINNYLLIGDSTSE